MTLTGLALICVLIGILCNVFSVEADFKKLAYIIMAVLVIIALFDLIAGHIGYRAIGLP